MDSFWNDCVSWLCSFLKGTERVASRAFCRQSRVVFLYILHGWWGRYPLSFCQSILRRVFGCVWRACGMMDIERVKFPSGGLGVLFGRVRVPGV